MKRIKLILLVFLFAIGTSKTYAQDKWEYSIETIKLSEAEVVDSIIIKMLDSAFTFLRLPPLEFGSYYYSLTINKDTIPVKRPYYKVNLRVEDYLFQDEEFSLFNAYDKLLFIYKGVHILIYYNVKNQNTFALQYFRPTKRKVDFYLYNKKDKANPDIVFRPDKFYIQDVLFWVSRRSITFMGYKLNIRKDLLN